MGCREFEAIASRYVDNDLDAEVASAARGHLRDCCACRERADDEAEIAAAARALRTEDLTPGEGWDALWEGIRARVAEEERADAARPRWVRWWRSHGRRAAVATAAAAALVGLAFGSPRPLGGGPGAGAGGDDVVAGETVSERAERERLEAASWVREKLEDIRDISVRENDYLPDDHRRATAAERAALEREGAPAEEMVFLYQRQAAGVVLDGAFSGTRDGGGGGTRISAVRAGAEGEVHGYPLIEVDREGEAGEAGRPPDAFSLPRPRPPEPARARATARVPEGGGAW